MLTGVDWRKTIMENTLELNYFWVLTKSRKLGQSGGLNTKTCRLAGLDGRRTPFLQVFQPNCCNSVSVDGLEPATIWLAKRRTFGLKGQ